jgi:hypothetical protein
MLSTRGQFFRFYHALKVIPQTTALATIISQLVAATVLLNRINLIDISADLIYIFCDDKINGRREIHEFQLSKNICVFNRDVSEDKKLETSFAELKINFYSILGKYNRAKIKINDLKQKLANFELSNSKTRFRDHQIKQHSTSENLKKNIQESVLQRLNDRLFVGKSKPLDPEILDIAFILQSYSYSGYEILRRYIPFPSRKSIDRHYIPQINQIQESISFINKIAQTVKHLPENCQITLAIDAVSVDNVFVQQHSIIEEQPKTAFFFNCQPLNMAHNCFPIHVLAAKSGSADESVGRTLSQILSELRKMNITARFIVTDGDSFYNKYHYAQFQKWFYLLQNDPFDNLLEEINTMQEFWITDYLHLAKTMRTRLLK